MRRVYFDHNATTPLDPRVRDEMVPWLGERYGNPSSPHAFGQEAREAVETARDRVARLIGASPLEIVFTASGTESNNAVILSQTRRAGFGGHLVLSAVEHPSVQRAADLARELGVELTRLPVDGNARVDPAELAAALREDTFLVCLMLANNEVGTVQAVAEAGAICRERGVHLLCDAVQGVGKRPVDVTELEADFLTLGAHKFSGPTGAAALWLRKGSDFEPLLLGGSQERRRRASTENVAAIVGLGRAADLAERELETRVAHLRSLRERFESGLAAIPDAIVHACGAERLPNTSHVAFPGADAQALMIRLDLAGYAVSTGSACASGVVEPSAGMVAMGVPREEALASVRVSFGTPNTAEEVDGFLSVLAEEVAGLRRRAAAS